MSEEKDANPQVLGKIIAIKMAMFFNRFSWLPVISLLKEIKELKGYKDKNGGDFERFLEKNVVPHIGIHQKTLTEMVRNSEKYTEEFFRIGLSLGFGRNQWRRLEKLQEESMIEVLGDSIKIDGQLIKFSSENKDEIEKAVATAWQACTERQKLEIEKRKQESEKDARTIERLRKEPERLQRELAHLAQEKQALAEQLISKKEGRPPEELKIAQVLLRAKMQIEGVYADVAEIDPAKISKRLKHEIACWYSWTLHTAIIESDAGHNKFGLPQMSFPLDVEPSENAIEELEKTSEIVRFGEYDEAKKKWITETSFHEDKPDSGPS